MRPPEAGDRRVVLVAAAGMAMIVIALLANGLSALRADQRRAAALDRSTAAVERQVAVGRYVATHLATEDRRARRLSVAVPAVVDDQSILAGVVAATRSSNTQLSDEQRGPSATSAANAAAVVPRSSSVVAVPLNITVNGPNPVSLVAFAAAVQHQARLLRADALDFTFTGGDTLQVDATAFTRSAALTSPTGSAFQITTAVGP